MSFTKRLKLLLTDVEGGGIGSEDAVMSTITAGTNKLVPANYQQAVFGSLVVDGSMTVAGTLKVCAWPA